MLTMYQIVIIECINRNISCKTLLCSKQRWRHDDEIDDLRKMFIPFELLINHWILSSLSRPSDLEKSLGEKLSSDEVNY